MPHREGRRASDGLVAQGILHSHSEYPINTTVAFNSESLHETSKSKGILELHLLQKEAAQLKTKYEANVSMDEMATRQQQHSQFYVCPLSQNGQALFGGGYASAGYYGLQRDMDSLKLTSLRDMGKMIDPVQQLQLQQHHTFSQFQNKNHPQLQQQLMQHRLLQQKRHIFQKQVNSEPGMNRRHILRQQSYKFAQQQPVGPTGVFQDIDVLGDNSLPWSIIDEPPTSCSPELLSLTPHGSPIKIKSVTNSNHGTLNDCWNDLSGSMQLCQISENLIGPENWIKTSQAQSYYNQQHQQI